MVLGTPGLPGVSEPLGMYSFLVFPVQELTIWKSPIRAPKGYWAPWVPWGYFVARVDAG